MCWPSLTHTSAHKHTHKQKCGKYIGPKREVMKKGVGKKWGPKAQSHQEVANVVAKYVIPELRFVGLAVVGNKLTQGHNNLSALLFLHLNLQLFTIKHFL